MNDNKLLEGTHNDFENVEKYFKKIINKIELNYKKIEKSKCVKQEYINVNEDNWDKECKEYKAKFKSVTGNIYFIFNEEFELMYIGTRKSNEINARLKQHLFKTPDGTNSMLENVKNYIINEKEGTGNLYYTAINVNNMIRTSIEDALSVKLKPKWNCRKNN